jgi:YfiH family protein
VITAPLLAAIPGVRHGFFTRRGGVSRGLYNSLNCGFGSGDPVENVAANRARAAKRIGAQANALVTGYQEHGIKVAVVEAPWQAQQAPVADGLVTKMPGIALGVLTADCAPVLFADSQGGVIGSAHAGWKGALSGVLEATVEAMEQLGARPASLIAVIGPCIGRESYEVGPKFRRTFLDNDAANREFFNKVPGTERFLFDLSGHIHQRLSRLGLAAVSELGEDTCADESRFFSYRRATLRGEADCGRGIAAIMMEFGP